MSLWVSLKLAGCRLTPGAPPVAHIVIPTISVGPPQAACVTLSTCSDGGGRKQASRPIRSGPQMGLSLDEQHRSSGQHRAGSVVVVVGPGGSVVGGSIPQT